MVLSQVEHKNPDNSLGCICESGFWDSHLDQAKDLKVEPCHWYNSGTRKACSKGCNRMQTPVAASQHSLVASALRLSARRDALSVGCFAKT